MSEEYELKDRDVDVNIKEYKEVHEGRKWKGRDMKVNVVILR